MIIIKDKNIHYISTNDNDIVYEVDIEAIHGLDDSPEDKMLAIYKSYVEHNAGLVILDSRDLDVGNRLQKENVLVSYITGGNDE